MEDIKLSIIVPVYNCELTIERCIDSILKSKFNKFEILIINDASKDNSKNVIEYKYLNNDRIKVINLKQNRGVSFCRNLGIKNAKGKYITFVDADDYITDSMYSNMMNIIYKNDVECCICDYSEVFSDGRIQKSKYRYENIKLNREEAIKRYLVDGISPAIWDKIFKADILKKYVKFNEDLKVGEDILFCLDFFYRVENIYLLNEINYFYIQQEQSVMHIVSPKLLQFKQVSKSIEQEKYNYYSKSYSDEFDYFKGAMFMRGIHSLTMLYNNTNKKQVIEYLNELNKKNILEMHIKNKYTSKFIKIEASIIRYLGINIHLMLSPIYIKLREKIRKK